MNTLRATIAAITVLGIGSYSSTTHAVLEEIVVSAQKRSESLQDVPIAVTAFTGDGMKELGVNNAADLVPLTPGLSERKQSGSNTSYFLRGVGTNDIHLTAAPAVGQYFDEVTLTSGFQARTALFDMARVEVLKGPQNTLFGLNTTGGTVSYYSNQPEIGGGTQGYFDARVGSHSLFNIEGAVGFELGEDAAMRLSATSNTSEGEFDSVYDGRDFGDNDSQALRAQILWQPSDSTDILLNVHWAQSENNGTGYKVLGSRAPDGSGDSCSEFIATVVPDFDNNTSCLTVPPPAAGDFGPGASGIDPSFEDWQDIGTSFGGEDVETHGFFVKLNHEFESAILTSITAFDNLEFQNANDLDGSALGLMHLQQEDDRDIFQQELRLVSTSDGAFRWIGGMYYLKEEADSYTGLRSNLIGNWAILPNVQLDHEKENFGVYGQTEFDVSESLTFTLGLRWSDEEINGDYLPSRPNVVGIADSTPLFANDVNALVAAQNPGTPEFDSNGFEIARQVSQKLSNSDVGFTAKLDYKFGEDSLAYVSFSRGFKGSALDIRAAYALVPVGNVLTGLEDARLDPESLDAWEIGYKSSYLDNRVQLDVAAFHYTYENLQQFITDRGIPTLDNAPESEITGFDANLKFANDSGFYGQLSVAVLDTELTNVEGSQFVDGVPLASSPELSYSALVSQEFEIGDGLLNVMANLLYTDEQHSETQTVATSSGGGAYNTTQDYTLVNVAATYRFGGDRQYRIGIYGNNLGNERFCHGLRSSDNANLFTPGLAGRHHGNHTCMVSNASVRTYGINFGIDF